MHLSVRTTRVFLGVAAQAVLVLSTGLPVADLGAEGYPSRPVRIVFASSAGTSGDARTRLVADKLATRLGQRFVVENKPGAGTTIATNIVSAAKPDGYVLLSTFTPALPLGPLLYADARYDPISWFTPIAMFAQGSPFLVVHPSVPARTVKEFVALAKAKAGSISVAHAGLGAANHLPAELLRQTAGIDLLYVTYKSESDALPDLLSGQVSAMFAYAAVAVPQIKAGRLRALAVAQSHRNEALPDVPTIAEAGYPGCEFHGTMLLLAPAGVPKDIVALLNKEINAIMQEQEVRAIYATTGADPVYGSPEEVRALIARETEKNGALVKRLGIKPQ